MQLTTARQQQAQLPNLQAQVSAATQQLTALQQQQTTLLNTITNGQATLRKLQTDLDSLSAEIRNLTAARDQLAQAVGQRGELERALKALNDEIGKRQAVVAGLKSEADQASAERQVAVAERAGAERQRIDLAAQVIRLQAQRDQIEKEHAATSALAAKAEVSLTGMQRQRDAAELDVVRLRDLASALAIPKTVQTAPTAPNIKQEAP